MFFPDITYAYQFPKDTSGPTLETFVRETTNSDTLTVLVAGTFQNLPLDKALILTNASAVANPEPGGHVRALILTGTTPALNTFRIYQEQETLTPDENLRANWQGAVCILGGGPGTVQLQWSATFNTAVAANVLQASVSGYIIPRANIANA